MTNRNNDIEELEELLTELDGSESQMATYAEEDDAVTQLLEAPLSDQEWMVQVTALDRRMMATSQIATEFRQGKLNEKTLVWRSGMDDWTALANVAELKTVLGATAASPPTIAPAPAATPSVPRSVVAPSPVAAAPAAPALVSAPRLERPAISNTTRPVAMDMPAAPEPVELKASRPNRKAMLTLGAVAVLAVAVLGKKFASDGEVPVASAPEAATAKKSGEEKKAAAPASDKKAAAEPMNAPAGLKKDVAEPAKAEEGKEAVAEVKAEPVKAEPEVAKAEPAKAEPAPAEDSGDSAADDEPSKPSRSARVRGTTAKTKSKTRGTNQVAAAAPAAEAKAEEEKAPADEEPASTKRGGGGGGFDTDAARDALALAARQAANCRPDGGPTGAGQVQVRYEPSGEVESVSIQTSKFDNTTTGSCVKMLFRRAKIPAFSGAAKTVTTSFTIP